MYAFRTYFPLIKKKQQQAIWFANLCNLNKTIKLNTLWNLNCKHLSCTNAWTTIHIDIIQNINIEWTNVHMFQFNAMIQHHYHI